jgi:hypothetical protein
VFFLWSKSVPWTKVITNQQLNLHNVAESFIWIQQSFSLSRNSLPLMAPKISLSHAQEHGKMNLVHLLTTHLSDQLKPGGKCMCHQFSNITKLSILHTHFILCVPSNSHHKKWEILYKPLHNCSLCGTNRIFIFL